MVGVVVVVIIWSSLAGVSESAGQRVCGLASFFVDVIRVELRVSPLHQTMKPFGSGRDDKAITDKNTSRATLIKFLRFHWLMF